MTTMFNVKGFADSKQILDWTMPAIPRKGDVVHLMAAKQYDVVQVLWRLDTVRADGRYIVHLYLEPIK